MKEGLEQDIVSGTLKTSVHVIMTSILLIAIRGGSRNIYIPGILGELVRLAFFTLLLFFLFEIHSEIIHTQYARMLYILSEY